MADGVASAVAHAAKVKLHECSRVVVFDDASVFFCNFHAAPAELQQLAAAFQDREAAIRAGLTVDGRRYEVHRWHLPLVYGRSMGDCEPDESSGIALCRTERGPGGRPAYCLITYEMPNVSARMVPLLSEFCRQHLEGGGGAAAAAADSAPK